MEYITGQQRAEEARSMQRRQFLKLTSLSVAAAAAPKLGAHAMGPTTPGSRKPNIIFIISDQHRAGLTKRKGIFWTRARHWTGLRRVESHLIALTARRRSAFRAERACLRDAGPRQRTFEAMTC